MTHLLSIDKDSFDLAIQRGLNRIMSENVDFLKSIPFFNHWTKNSLAKFFLYSVEQIHAKRNQIICKEGQALNYIYFIKEGDFSVTKKINLAEEVKQETSYGNMLFKKIASPTRKPSS